MGLYFPRSHAWRRLALFRITCRILERALQYLRVRTFRFSTHFIFWADELWETIGVSLHANQSDVTPHFRFLRQPICLVAVRYNHAVGIVHWRVRRDAGAEYGTVRKLDHYYSQLCVAAVSACRRSALTAISWEGPWNTRVFHCGRPSGIGERLTVGNSRRPDVSDAICLGYYMDVSTAALCRRLARSLVSGCAVVLRSDSPELRSSQCTSLQAK